MAFTKKVVKEDETTDPYRAKELARRKQRPGPSVVPHPALLVHTG